MSVEIVEIISISHAPHIPTRMENNNYLDKMDKEIIKLKDIIKDLKAKNRRLKHALEKR
jgi:hypothetical protein